MQLVGGIADKILLYVEAGEGWIEPSLFRDEGNAIRYYNPGDFEFSNMLMEVWYIKEPERRWTTMHYTIDGGKFDAQFDFDDLKGSGEDSLDRRDRALRARFGDKPVVYPPPSPHAWTLKPPA